MDPRLIGPSIFLVASILVILLIISVVIMLLRRKTKADAALKESLDPVTMEDEMEILAAAKIAQREQYESLSHDETSNSSPGTDEKDGFPEGESLVDE